MFETEEERNLTHHKLFEPGWKCRGLSGHSWPTLEETKPTPKSIGPPKISVPISKNLARLHDTCLQDSPSRLAFNQPNFNIETYCIYFLKICGFHMIWFIIFQCPHISSYQHQQKCRETMKKPSKIQLPTNFLAISWMDPGGWIWYNLSCYKFSILQPSLNPWTCINALPYDFCQIWRKQSDESLPLSSPRISALWYILFRFSKPHFPVRYLYHTLPNAMFYWRMHGLPMPKASILGEHPSIYYVSRKHQS